MGDIFAVATLVWAFYRLHALGSGVFPLDYPGGCTPPQNGSKGVRLRLLRRFSLALGQGHVPYPLSCLWRASLEPSSSQIGLGVMRRPFYPHCVQAFPCKLGLSEPKWAPEWARGSCFLAFLPQGVTWVPRSPDWLALGVKRVLHPPVWTICPLSRQYAKQFYQFGGSGVRFSHQFSVGEALRGLAHLSFGNMATLYPSRWI